MTDEPLPAFSHRGWSAIRSPEDLGRALARLRFTHDLTQEEQAQRLGISRRYVYEIESGRPNLYALRVFETLSLLGAELTLTPDPDHDSAVGAHRK